MLLGYQGYFIFWYRFHGHMYGSFENLLEPLLPNVGAFVNVCYSFIQSLNVLLSKN